MALPLPSAEMALPGSAPPSPLQILLDVPRRPQERNLDCELRSATDLAAYYGWNFTWQQLFEVVGVDPGGDPNLGFVGAASTTQWAVCIRPATASMPSR